VTIAADEMLLRTAVDALLENAVHYTDDYARIALSAPLDGDQVVIIVCDEGYASSLAAVSLQELGLAQATDLVGGFRAWKAAGLPVTAPA